ncbi:MAG: hypothetical protein IT305_13715 [Chloroflexi bacterium]|nr:hypothetical protein [Chloroflexota bacterium]
MELPLQRSRDTRSRFRRRLGGVKAHLRREGRILLRTLTDIAPKLAMARLAPSPADVLLSPRQRHLRWPAALPEVAAAGDLLTYLRAGGFRAVDSRHTLYVPPQPGLKDALGSFVDDYPPDAGFKILKHLAPPASAHYLVQAERRWVTRRVIGSVDRQADAANALYVCGIGPRLYDVAELSSGTTHMTCFVVEHVDGSPPDDADYDAFMERLHGLLDGEVRHAVGLMASMRLSSRDFGRPRCNGNLLRRTRDGHSLYVDFQSFVIINRAAILESALRSIERQQSGTTAAVQADRGRLASTWRRQAAEDRQRWARCARLLAGAGITLDGRVLFDVGCGNGTLLANALAAGARYGMGWDRRVAAAEAIQCMSGNTRTSFVATRPDEAQRFADDVPACLRRSAEGAVLIYRTDQPGFPVPRDLSDIPWTAVLVERRAGDTPADYARVRQAVEERWRCRRIASDDHHDADRTGPPIELFVRDTAGTGTLAPRVNGAAHAVTSIGDGASSGARG